MSLRQNKRGSWIYLKTFGRAWKYQRTLPKHIITKEQAEEYIKAIPASEYKGYDVRAKYKSVKMLFGEAIQYFRSHKDLEFHDDIEPFRDYCLENEIGINDILNITPNTTEHYSQNQMKTSSPQKHNKRIRAIAKLHQYISNETDAAPLKFNIEKFLVKENNTRHTYFSEKFFELLIEKYPKEFMGDDLELIKKPFGLDGLVPDSIFIDTEGTYHVVEIVKGRLDRAHAYKILEYRDKLEKKLTDKGQVPVVKMAVVLIGNECPADRETFLKKYDIRFVMIPVKHVEKILVELLGLCA